MRNKLRGLNILKAREIIAPKKQDDIEARLKYHSVTKHFRTLILTRTKIFRSIHHKDNNKFLVDKPW